MPDKKTMIKQLKKMMKTRGKLNAFCKSHELNYNYVYRVAEGLISNPSFEQGRKIEMALAKELETSAANAKGKEKVEA
ncbi:MAG: hypothetical protein ACK5M8_21975 [Shewanella algae]|uniref:hypothetical protein n=1 Tax=Shewanella TaxID=22 RepID=UPI0011830961|nr:MULTISPECIES: hypothetical protein [Shewanella]NJI84784.1 hypothetical protein [Shewanella sp. Iso12]